MPPSQPVQHFKCVVLGDSAVGKSCLVVRFVRDEFYEHEEPTIGAAFLTQTVQVRVCVLCLSLFHTYPKCLSHCIALIPPSPSSPPPVYRILKPSLW